jgi:hypothetical protein
MLQKMRNQQVFGKMFECQKKESHICQKKIIGGLLEILDLVDQIQRFFIGFEMKIYHQNEVMYEMIAKSGWRFGIMYLWSLISFQTENL